MRNYTNYNSNKYSSYTPKKPVKNFTDLEVYQKALEGSVFVANEAMNFWEASRPRAEVAKADVKRSHKSLSPKPKQTQNTDSQKFCMDELESTIIKTMCITALSIPHLIAESHSKRFGESTECLKILDEVMLRCNKMVVYLEQTRDICAVGIETERFKEEIDKYFYIRRKVLNLQRVWRKYIIENSKFQIPISK